MELLCLTSNHFLWMIKLCNDMNGEYTQSCGEQSCRCIGAIEGKNGEMSKVNSTNWSGSENNGSNIMEDELWLYSTTSRRCPFGFCSILLQATIIWTQHLVKNWQNDPKLTSSHIISNACHILWKGW